MNPSITAAEANAGGEALGWPRRTRISLILEIDVSDQESLDYFLAPPSGDELQIGFLADLFDLFNFQQDFGVLSINGRTHAEIRKLFTL